MDELSHYLQVCNGSLGTYIRYSKLQTIQLQYMNLLWIYPYNIRPMDCFIEYGVMTRFDIITFFSAQHHYTQNTTPEQQSYQKHQ